MGRLEGSVDRRESRLSHASTSCLPLKEEWMDLGLDMRYQGVYKIESQSNREKSAIDAPVAKELVYLAVKLLKYGHHLTWKDGA